MKDYEKQQQTIFRQLENLGNQIKDREEIIHQYEFQNENKNNAFYELFVD